MSIFRCVELLCVHMTSELIISTPLVSVIKQVFNYKNRSMLTPQNIDNSWLNTKQFTCNFILFSCKLECQPCFYGNPKYQT